MSVDFDRWQVDDAIYSSIISAADAYGVPRALMLAVPGPESGFRAGARGDACRALGLDCTNADDAGYCSFGLYQFNRCGGAGASSSIEQLLDAGYNAQLAARTMRGRYDATGSWYEALQPWSTRPTAWTLYQAYASGVTDAPGQQPTQADPRMPDAPPQPGSEGVSLTGFAGFVLLAVGGGLLLGNLLSSMSSDAGGGGYRGRAFR